jgi:hypothetical protein
MTPALIGGDNVGAAAEAKVVTSRFWWQWQRDDPVDLAVNTTDLFTL